MGSRLLLQWIKQPLLDVDEISDRQDIVEVFVTDMHLTKELRVRRKSVKSKSSRTIRQKI